MSVTGIIAEYNPFHNGHLYQIHQIRRTDPAARIICVLSGSFTQRGTAAVLSKWQRASLAISGGADLVLELPFVFAVRSAQDFARGGVQLLDRLGLVDALSFGSEYTDLQQLQHIANQIDAPGLRNLLREKLQQGQSYAAALSHSIAAFSGIDEALLKKPNTILAIEYLRSLQHSHAQIRPCPLQRKTSAYHDTTIHASLASASAIRTELYQKEPDTNLLAQALPAESMQLLLLQQEQHLLPNEEYLLRPLLQTLFHTSLPELRTIYGINEGLEHRLLATASQSSSLTGFLTQVKSKRYPQSRLQRLMLYLLLDLSKTAIAAFDKTGPLYARALAFNEAGRSLLHAGKHSAEIPIITKTAQFLTSSQRARGLHTLSPLQQMLAYDTMAADLYGLCFAQPQLPGQDFKVSPIFTKS